MKKTKLTKFQWSVLKATLKIPLGQTRSYQWIAIQIGRPRAVRAVGQALKNNPFPVLIPCHRVIKSDGKLGGYAGKFNNGRKKRLLELERRISQELNSLHLSGVRLSNEARIGYGLRKRSRDDPSGRHLPVARGQRPRHGQVLHQSTRQGEVASDAVKNRIPVTQNRNGYRNPNLYRS